MMALTCAGSAARTQIMLEMPSRVAPVARVFPFASVGTRKALMPLCFFDRSVMAKTRIASACGPFVMKFFEPERT